MTDAELDALTLRLKRGSLRYLAETFDHLIASLRESRARIAELEADRDREKAYFEARVRTVEGHLSAADSRENALRAKVAKLERELSSLSLSRFTRSLERDDARARIAELEAAIERVKAMCLRTAMCEHGWQFPQQVVAALEREVGESLDVSRDPDTIAAVRESQDAINRGQITWDDGTLMVYAGLYALDPVVTRPGTHTYEHFLPIPADRRREAAMTDAELDTLQAQRKRGSLPIDLAKTFDRLIASLRESRARIAELERELDALQAKIDAVKALHKPCRCGCYTCDEHCVTWDDRRHSCDTIAALEGEKYRRD